MKTFVKSSVGATCSKFGLCAAALISISVATSSAQDKIGINFSGRQWSIGGNTPETLAASGTAGIVSQQNWNNVDPAGHDSGTQTQITGPNATAVSDNSGAATGVTLNYTAQGMWSVSQTTFVGNQQLMNGYSDVENDTAFGTYAISNISYTIY